MTSVRRRRGREIGNSPPKEGGGQEEGDGFAGKKVFWGGEQCNSLSDEKGKGEANANPDKKRTLRRRKGKLQERTLRIPRSSERKERGSIPLWENKRQSEGIS